MLQMMFWPDQKVALVIVDDPSGAGYDRRDYPDWNVVEVTTAEMDDLEMSRDAMDKVSDALGVPRVERTPEWLAANERLFYTLKGLYS